jgi:RND superfamily putative drug exporter
MDSLFAALGRNVVRFRYLIVVAWLVVTVLAVKGLPSLSSVSDNNNSAFLPAHEPSMVAAQLAAPFQHGTAPTALIVAGRVGQPLTAADQAAVTRAEAAARQVTDVADVRDQ